MLICFGLVVVEAVDAHAAPDDHAVTTLERSVAAVEHLRPVVPLERGHESAAVGALDE